MTSISVQMTSDDHPRVLQETKVVLIWSFTVWLVVMNTTMFNVALPTVLMDLSITSSTASWIVSGYSIVFAIATLTFSRLSDYIPIGKLLLIGLTILGMASMIGFLSNSFILLLVARILQAAGAGAVPGLAMVLAGRYIPISRRGRVMAYISSAASLGFGLGPVLGGIITQYLGWNYLFAVTGFVILLIPFFKKLLPEEEIKKVKFDTFGGLLTGLSVTGLLLFLSSFSFVYLICSIVLLLVMWRHIHQIDMPFVQPKLLKNKRYMQLLSIGFFVFLTHFATLFLMPIILTVVFFKDPAEVGLLIFPGAILSAIAAQFIGRLIDQFGNLPIIIMGQLLLLIATILFTLTSTISPYYILFTYMFMSTGFSALTSSISNEISRILTDEEIGAGMGMAQLFQFFGGAFGVTVTGIALTILHDMSQNLMYSIIFSGLVILILGGFMIIGFYIRNGERRLSR
ncbi:MFS transporter [Bacillus sp. DJP31]|uniref:MFS transporter n=1 Tax=Bacillus sp. DJP31 TaxID=3409789 RepID=UPI003BB544D9